MSTFICEKCGCIDNSALNNNYWHAKMNKYRHKKGAQIDLCFKPEHDYFEDHMCCSECCTGVTYDDNSGVISQGWHNRFDKEHWSKYGADKILEYAKMCNGSFENGIEYLLDAGVITKEMAEKAYKDCRKRR